MGKVVKKVGKVIGKVFKGVIGFVGMLFSPPKTPKASANAATEARLNVTLVPEENRKIVFGETALGTDLRFWETFGSKNERHVQVIAAAGHAIESFGNLYIDEIPVPLDPYQPLPGNKYYQALIRYVVTSGNSGVGPFGSGTRWTAASSFHGCAYFVLEWVYSQEKLTNGIPSRITQVGKGAKVYDPRRDSTKGGVGSHRADNPDTWEYAPTDSNGQPIGRNNALQMLTYQLGLFIRNKQTNALVLVGGRGVDPDDVAFETFAVAANYCEIYKWYSDCVLSTGDSHSTNEGILEAAAGGQLVDVGGRFSYYVAADDTANAVVYLDENDIVGDIDWDPQPSLSEQFNELPGTFVDPAALFQTRPLPMAWDQAYYDEDGYKKRGGEMRLSAVQDPVQGQKLLRIALNKTRFPGVFTAPFNLKGLKVQKHSLIRLSFEPFAWVNKLFRVDQQGIADEGGIQLVLREEDASIYTPGTVAVVPPPSAGYGGDRNVKIAVTGLATLATGIESGSSAVDAIRVSWTTDDQRILHTEVRFRKTGEADWQTSAPLRRDILSALISPVMPTTQYEVQVRHISVWYVPGDWVSSIRTTDAVTKNPITGEITYADGTPIEDLKPSGPNANQTQAHISAGFAGQGALATQNQVTWASQVTGVGKPANDANVSRVFTQQATPSGQTVNDIWIKLNGSNQPIAVAAWNGSVWVDGGNVTSFYTAAGIAGQGPGATAAAGDVLNNALFGPNANRVYFSDFEKGTEGWAIENSTGGSFFTGVNNYKYIRYQWTATAGQNVRLVQPNAYAFSATPNERISVQARMQTASAAGAIASSTLYINWLNENNVSVGNTTIYDKTNDMPTTDIALFITVPAGAVKGRFIARAIMNAGGPFPDTNILLYRPMVTPANASQTIHPPYSPGPSNVPAADVTSGNIAGGITGQAPDATVSYVGNTYANNAAAIAAGRAVGWIYWNSTTSSRMAVVAAADGLSASVNTSFISGNRFGAGNVQTTQNVVVTVSGGTAGTSIRWVRLYGDTRINMNDASSFNTGAYMNIGVGEVANAYFQGIVTRAGQSVNVYVQVDFAENT